MAHPRTIATYNRLIDPAENPGLHDSVERLMAGEGATVDNVHTTVAASIRFPATLSRDGDISYPGYERLRFERPEGSSTAEAFSLSEEGSRGPLLLPPEDELQRLEEAGDDYARGRLWYETVRTAEFGSEEAALRLVNVGGLDDIMQAVVSIFQIIPDTESYERFTEARDDILRSISLEGVPSQPAWQRALKAVHNKNGLPFQNSQESLRSGASVPDVIASLRDNRFR